MTDHADASNLEDLQAYRRFMDMEAARFAVRVIPGVELTHVPPDLIDELARQAKALGARVVGVHGETIVEPVAPGTNRAAVASRHVDFLAHPGFLSAEGARAAAGGVFIELTARQALLDQRPRGPGGPRGRRGAHRQLRRPRARGPDRRRVLRAAGGPGGGPVRRGGQRRDAINSPAALRARVNC